MKFPISHTWTSENISVFSKADVLGPFIPALLYDLLCHMSLFWVVGVRVFVLIYSISFSRSETDKENVIQHDFVSSTQWWTYRTFFLLRSLAGSLLDTGTRAPHSRSFIITPSLKMLAHSSEDSSNWIKDEGEEGGCAQFLHLLICVGIKLDSRGIIDPRVVPHRLQSKVR